MSNIFNDTNLYIKTATQIKTEAKRRLAVQWRKHHKNPKSLVKNLADFLENDALTQIGNINKTFKITPYRAIF